MLSYTPLTLAAEASCFWFCICLCLPLRLHPLPGRLFAAFSHEAAMIPVWPIAPFREWKAPTAILLLASV